MTGHIWAVIDLGANYAIGASECWGASLASCRRIFRNYLNGWSQDGLRCPCVDGEASEAWLYVGGRPEDRQDPHPDLRMFVGPRGGIRVEKC